MRLIQTLSVALLFSLTSAAIADQYTTIVDAKGRSLEVHIVTHTSTYVECITKKGGKKFNIPLHKLSSESVELIKEIPLIDSKVTVVKERDSAPGQSGSAFGGSSITYLKGKIEVLNKTPDIKLADCKNQIFFIGVGNDDGETFHTTIDETSFNFAPSAKKEVRRIEEIEVPEELKYKGYVFFVTDENQRIISATTSIKELKGKLSPELHEALTQLELDAKLSPEFIASS